MTEWLKRVELLKEKPHEIISTFTEAVQTVDPKQAVGRLSTLWVSFSKFYEDNDQINDARLFFKFKVNHRVIIHTRSIILGLFLKKPLMCLS